MDRKKVAYCAAATVIGTAVGFTIATTATLHLTPAPPAATTAAQPIRSPLYSSDREVCTVASGYQNGVPDDRAAKTLTDRLWGLYGAADRTQTAVFILHNASPGVDAYYTLAYYNTALESLNKDCAANGALR